ncbi:hypothetical protein [Ralstonia mannitolilytica]|jgi:hypothetical protein|nr:hypothetical protein [Ralstonia mannitolilytica]CAJ0740867.1 hypothetical protein R76696_03180 [Ralstonia mannitolilytica]
MTSLVTRLAHGALSTRPALAFALLLLLFGLAGAVAPEIPPLP